MLKVLREGLYMFCYGARYGLMGGFWSPIFGPISKIIFWAILISLAIKLIRNNRSQDNSI